MTKRLADCTPEEAEKIRVYREARRKYAQERYKTDPLYREKVKAYVRAWRKREPEKTRHRIRNRKRYHTPEAYAYYAEYRRTHKMTLEQRRSYYKPKA
jgi:hypothetical protein